ncbi:MULTISPECIES: proton pump complex quinol oxidase subunit SoxA [Sulfurisphaera]|uniref:Quinol oxidase subunit II n=3 Tax=Sulfurisphaera TaxID=69655 RepID=F9VML6_SULTO|nr:quinol oxidase subunit II [Sulfurisphaera tokodaii str. 7]
MIIMSFIKEHAELVWFVVMLTLVAIFSGWNIYGVTHGTSTSYRYGLPCFSGLPKQAQQAVLYFNSHPPSGQSYEVVNGILVVNMTITQQNGFQPDLIIANTSEPVVIILNSPQVITGFYLRLPDGVVQVNAVPGTPSYIYFVTPPTPGNFTWRDSEYSAYNFSYFTGTLEVM